LPPWSHVRHQWTFVLACAVSGYVLLLVHHRLSVAPVPFEGGLDAAFHVVLMTLKLFTLIAIPVVAMRRVLGHLRGNPRRAAVAFLVWSVASALLLLVMNARRVALEKEVNTYTSSYYMTQLPNTAEHPYTRHDFQEFPARWASGEIFFIEFAVMAISAAGLALIGLMFGTPALSAILTSIGYMIVMVVMCVATGLAVLDYDFFYAGTILGPLVTDLMVPHAAIRESLAAFPLYLMILLSSAALDAFWTRRPAPMAEKSRAEPTTQH